jgi:hypothetical protein
MRTLMLGMAFAFVATAAGAGPQCTSAAKDKWLSETAMKAKIAALGYKYKVFKVTSGNCYEIYGQNKKGQRVEVYFDPVTGNIHTEHKS